MTPLPRTKLGRRIDWLIIVAFALLAANAMRAQSVIGYGDIVSQRNDGCNTTTCYSSGVCSSTLAYCLTLPTTRKITATTICGTDQRNPSANIDLLQVACVDYDALRAASPQYPWPAGKVTQVLLHVREGDAVRVTVDGVAKFADTSTDAWGRRVALVVFDGVGHESVAVRVYRAVEE